MLPKPDQNIYKIHLISTVAVENTKKNIPREYRIKEIINRKQLIPDDQFGFKYKYVTI